MKNNRYETIIVGTGVAGLFTALSLPKDCNVLMITKDKLKESNSYLAQGGISTLLQPNDYDTYFEDTMKAGRYKNSPESVQEMIKSSNSVVSKLIEYGVEFDKTENNTYEYTREGGHSVNRILHHQDITGKEIVEKLVDEVIRHKNITILEYTTMIDFIVKDNTCSGVVTHSKQGFQCYFAKAIFLASGGIGGIFQNSTNFPHITGDAIAIAIRHGITIENMNYIQIHPTVLYSKNKGRRFLISEAVRGEGAILLNEEKKRFVNELLPRDVLTEAIYNEMKKYHTDHVYLSLANIDREKILKHFPNIYSKCKEEGYDLFTDLIPVTPAQHYFMGGIKTDINGKTSMKFLYAIGETGCNKVHGANRLASNSLLESLVFSRNAANNFIALENNESKEELIVDVDLSMYQDLDKWEEENKEILFTEIKRRDKKFYDKWCEFKG